MYKATDQYLSTARPVVFEY